MIHKQLSSIKYLCMRFMIRTWDRRKETCKTKNRKMQNKEQKNANYYITTVHLSAHFINFLKRPLYSKKYLLNWTINSPKVLFFNKNKQIILSLQKSVIFPPYTQYYRPMSNVVNSITIALLLLSSRREITNLHRPITTNKYIRTRTKIN